MADFDHSKVEEEALLVLKYCQQRDFKELGKQMDMQKDEIINDLSFGRLALTIPEQHYELLTMAYPRLQHSDATTQALAWKEFMASELSLPYKVNQKMRSM